MSTDEVEAKLHQFFISTHYFQLKCPQYPTDHRAVSDMEAKRRIRTDPTVCESMDVYSATSHFITTAFVKQIIKFPQFVRLATSQLSVPSRPPHIRDNTSDYGSSELQFYTHNFFLGAHRTETVNARSSLVQGTYDVKANLQKWGMNWVISGVTQTSKKCSKPVSSQTFLIGPFCLEN